MKKFITLLLTLSLQVQTAQVINAQSMHTIEAVARDAAGNIGTDSIMVIVDNRPTITLISPTDGAKFNKSFTIKATSEGKIAAIKIMDIQVDGKVIATALTNVISANYNFQPAKIPTGAHRIIVRAWDTLDQQRTVEITVFKI